MKYLIVTFLLGLSIVSNGQSNRITRTLFRNSYKVFEIQRLSNGMYRDAKVFSGDDYHPVSVANTGMGLISLCIADTMNWEDNAKELALTTLKTLTGHNSSYSPNRNNNGYFRHFLAINTGERAWESEYSTIDTDILMSGALFCMNYFRDDEISKYVKELWNSIDFEAAIANPDAGEIFLEMNSDGTGKEEAITLPYNEYMIVAWLAKHANNVSDSPGNVLWNNYYSSVDSLPENSFNSFNVLTDNRSSFLPSFTHQFNYFLCHYFTTSDDYISALENAYKADSSWWSNTTDNETFEWGLGAGSAYSTGYHADAINNNPDKIVSPHIVAGFIPVNAKGRNDLTKMWESDTGIYTLPTADNESVLWRYSLKYPSWEAKEIIGIDYSTMLFGLASLPEYLGNTFFAENNDFFPLPDYITGFEKQTLENDFETEFFVYPNPNSGTFTLDLKKEYTDIMIKVYESNGKNLYKKHFDILQTAKLNITEEAGIYMIEVSSTQGKIAVLKVIKNK